MHPAGPFTLRMTLLLLAGTSAAAGYKIPVTKSGLRTPVIGQGNPDIRPGDPTWTSAIAKTAYAVHELGGDLRPARDHLDKLVAHVGNVEAQAKAAGGVAKARGTRRGVLAGLPLQLYSLLLTPINCTHARAYMHTQITAQPVSDTRNCR